MAKPPTPPPPGSPAPWPGYIESAIGSLKSHTVDPATGYNQAYAQWSRQNHPGSSTSGHKQSREDNFRRDRRIDWVLHGRDGLGPGEGLRGRAGVVVKGMGRAAIGTGDSRVVPSWIGGIYSGRHAGRFNDWANANTYLAAHDKTRRTVKGLGAVALGLTATIPAVLMSPAIPAAAPIAIGAAGTWLGVRAGRKARHIVKNHEVTTRLFGDSHTDPNAILPPHVDRLLEKLSDGWSANGRKGQIAAGIGALVLSPIWVPYAVATVGSRANRFTWHNRDQVKGELGDAADFLTDPTESLGKRLIASGMVAVAAATTAPAFAGQAIGWAAKNKRAAARNLFGRKADPIVPAHLRTPLGDYLTGKTAAEIWNDPSIDGLEQAVKIGTLALAGIVASPYTATAVTARAARFAIRNPKAAAQNTAAATSAAYNYLVPRVAKAAGAARTSGGARIARMRAKVGKIRPRSKSKP